MKKKKQKYVVGDVFKFQIDTNGKNVYGRILFIDSEDQLPVVEIYKIKPTNEDLSLSDFENAEVILKHRCFDIYFKNGNWKIIGNIPVEPFEEPYFLQYFDILGKYYLNRGNEQIDIDEKDIKPDMIGYCIAGEGYLKEVLIKLFIEQNLYE